MVPRVIGYIPEYRGVTGTPRGVSGSHGPKVVKRRGSQGRPRASSPLVRIGLGEGAAPPLSLSLPTSFLLLLGGGLLLGMP